MTVNEQVVHEILTHLNNRAGFDEWWESIDKTEQQDIRRGLEEIVAVQRGFPNGTRYRG